MDEFPSDDSESRSVIAGMIAPTDGHVEGVLKNIEYAFNFGLDAAWFASPKYQAAWRIIQNYYLKTNLPCPDEKVKGEGEDLGLPGDKIAQVEHLWMDSQRVSKLHRTFVDSLSRLRDLYRRRELYAAAFAFQDILAAGRAEVGGVEYWGIAGARTFMIGKLAEMVRQSEVQSAELREAMRDIDQDYEEIERAPDSYAVPTGIAEIDGLIGGVRPGDLCLIAGYTGQGKSSLMLQMAYTAVVRFKRTIVWGSGEMTLQDIKWRLLSRHSAEVAARGRGWVRKHYPGFDPDACIGAVAYADMRRGRVDPALKPFLFEVVKEDWVAASYGRFHSFIFDRDDTVEAVHTRFMTYGDLDVAFIDRLDNIWDPMMAKNRSEGLGNVVQKAKALALTFQGQGVPLLGCYQVSRAGHNRAERAGRYDLMSLALTAEAERMADVIVTILQKRRDNTYADPEKVARNVCSLGVIKNRGGEIDEEIEVEQDLATGAFGVIGGKIRLDG